jgi:hypothetical protein
MLRLNKLNLSELFMSNKIYEMESCGDTVLKKTYANRLKS